MTTDYMENLTKIQDDALAAIKQSQEVSLSTLTSMTEMTAKAPTAFLKSPAFEGMPSPAKMIEMSFDFASKFLDLRKEYTLKAAEIMASAQKQAEAATHQN